MTLKNWIYSLSILGAMALLFALQYSQPTEELSRRYFKKSPTMIACVPCAP